jgi:hypothetical protein
MQDRPSGTKDQHRRTNGARLVPVKTWSDVCSAPAASFTDEMRLKIRQPNIVGPSITADRDVMAAPVVGAIDQKPAHTGGAEFGEGDFLGTLHAP